MNMLTSDPSTSCSFIIGPIQASDVEDHFQPQVSEDSYYANRARISPGRLPKGSKGHYQQFSITIYLTKISHRREIP